MKKSGPANRRRNYFIKKSFQAKFILKFCLLLIFACVLMGVLMYVSSTRTVTTSFEDLRFVAKSTADFILPSLILCSIVAIILISIACIGVVLFLSHRLAGPLYRLEQSMHRIAAGDLTIETNLRTDDEIKALADSLNEMVKKMRGAIRSIHNEVAELEHSLSSLKKMMTHVGIAEGDIEAMVKPFDGDLRLLKTSLAAFKLD